MNPRFEIICALERQKASEARRKNALNGEKSNNDLQKAKWFGPWTVALFRRYSKEVTV